MSSSSIKTAQFLIKLGDGATPEVFTAPAGFTSRAFGRSVQTNRTVVPDALDPDAIVYEAIDAVAINGSITGSGIVADSDFDTWDEWFSSGETKNVKVTLVGSTTRTWAGKAHLTKFDIKGEHKKRVTFDATIDFDGEITRS